MENLSFTSAEATDAPLLADILTDAGKHKLEHNDLSWGTEGYSLDEATELINTSPTYFIRKDGEVVATVALQWDDESSWGVQPPVAAYIHRLAVKDGFHGQGLGEQIIDWANEQAVQNGRQFLRLDCDARNTSLCAYYENQGFVKVGTKQIPEYNDYIAALYERPVSI
jgi:ribosomal protein S18 acetylase RimI-like enzyme